MVRNFVLGAALSSVAFVGPTWPGAGGEAWAEDATSTTRLDAVVVTAGRTEQPISAIPGSVAVIDRDTIEAEMRVTTDPARLISRVVPGFSIGNQTLSGASETFRGRGVLVLLDGIPRNTPLRDVSRVLSLIDLSRVERIEVVNGASSLYGSGATGGTINFITRKSEDDTPKITVETRARAFTENVGKSIGPEATISVEQKIGDLDYFVSANGRKVRRTYDGKGRELPSDAMLGQGGGDRTTYGNLYGRLGYDIDGSKRIEVSAETVNLDQSPDYFTNYLARPAVPFFNAPYTGLPVTEKSRYFSAQYSDTDFLLGGLNIRLFHNDINKRFPFTQFDSVNNQVYYSGDPANPVASFNQTTLQTRRTGVNATVDTPLDDVREGMALTWGLDYVRDETSQVLLNGWNTMTPLSQDSVAAFAQLQVPVTDRLKLQGGLRYERYFLEVESFTRPAVYYINRAYPAISVGGGTFEYDDWTFNAGATFDLTDDAQLFGGFSQGFSLTDIGSFTRRAGFNTSAELCDAYGNLACPGAGAPDLALSYASIAPKPQLVNTYEVGLRTETPDYGGTVSAWLSTSEDGVNYDPATNRVSQQKEKLWGVEATGWFAVAPSTTIGAILAYREGRYDANRDGRVDSWLPNNRIATPFRGVVYASHAFDNGLNIRGEVEFFSGRDKIPTPNPLLVTTLDAAALVNVSATKKVGPGDLSLGIENLFDTDYMNPTASATRNTVVNGFGRTVTLSYKVTF